VSTKLAFEQIRKILNLLSVGIIVLDADNKALFINNFAKKLLQIDDFQFIDLKEICPQLYENNKLKDRLQLNNKTFRVESKRQGDLALITLEDITTIRSLESENKWLRTVFDSIHEGVHLTNTDGITILYNEACSKFEGLNKEEVVGKKITDVYDVDEENSTQLNVLRTGMPIVEQYHQYHTNDGKKIDLIASTYPYYENGRIAGVYSVNRDVTKMKEFLVKTAELQRRLADEQNNEEKNDQAHYTFDDIIGESAAIKQVKETAKKIARNESSVLIYGETGTGKELFAQSIHNASTFLEGPFIAINCAAIPESLLESLLFGTVKGAFTGAVDAPGLFEQAENGTLFLDEINSMGMHLQAKLLRVIQEKSFRRIGGFNQIKVNCRVISSTNKEPAVAIKEQEIRQDLYYRLAAVTLYIPPLRERTEDIKLLSQHFIEKYNKQFGTSVEMISSDLQDLFVRHHWPGNIRELQHVIESAMNMVDAHDKVLDIKNVPLYLRQKLGQSRHYQANIKKSGKLNDILQEIEKQIIVDTLHKNQGNISKTAEELGIFRQALQYRMKKFKITSNSIK
jgi:arginine utilization regulatory protein